MRFSYIFGIRFWDWIKLLSSCQLRLSPSCLPRAGAITVLSLVNSAWGGLEDLCYGPIIEDVEINAHPLFVLGHQRSGTTHLHNLLMLDPEFAAPTLPQVFFPHWLLLGERVLARLLASRLGGIRGFDNVRLEFDSPQEEELALCALGAPSTYLSLLLPRQIHETSNFRYFRGRPGPEAARWKTIYVRFLNKLTYKYGRRLALKSPPHTARIRTLLEIYPDARFVHIARHPYRVFQSYRSFLIYLFKNFSWLQEPRLEGLDERIFRHYSAMYDAYFEDLALLAPNRFHSLRFEDLEKSPISEMEALYTKLELPGFPSVKPRIEDYVKNLSGYRKNVYPDLTAEEKSKIRAAWNRSFESWHYEF
jgi:hypothetical protein